MKRSFITLSLALALSTSAAWSQEHGEGNAPEGQSHEGFHAPAVPFNLANPSAPPVAEAGREVKAPPPFLFGPVLNFAVLVVLGYMAVRRVVNPSLAARRAAVETEIAEAKRLHDEAQAMHSEMTSKLGSLDAEIASLKAQFTAAGEAERDRIVAEATARVERMRADGTATIEQELKNLREDLRREAIIAATAAAEATVRSSIGADDQRRLADEYLSGLEAAGTEGARA